MWSIIVESRQEERRRREVRTMTSRGGNDKMKKLAWDSGTDIVFV
jgi:hypothetical protein